MCLLRSREHPLHPWSFQSGRMNYGPHRSNKLILLTHCCMFKYQRPITGKGTKHSDPLAQKRLQSTSHITEIILLFSWISALKYRTGRLIFFQMQCLNSRTWTCKQGSLPWDFSRDSHVCCSPGRRSSPLPLGQIRILFCTLAHIKEISTDTHFPLGTLATAPQWAKL